jgi:hypothetical protein
MTKKRWIVLAGMLAACVCLTLAVLALLPPRPGVTSANFERIEDGMTQEEVEKILGGPAADWFSPKRGVSVTYFVWDHPYDRTQVFVGFRDNHVIQKEWGGPPDTFMQKLKRLLRL